MNSSNDETHDGSRLRIREAVPGDDADLRRILRHGAFGSRIVVSFEREPSFFHAEGVRGESTRTGVLTDDRRSEPLGLISRSVVPVHLGGEERRVGFVHTTRLPLGEGLAAAASFLRQARAPGDAPLDVLPVLEEEVELRQALLEPAAGLPRVVSAGSVTVFLVSVRAIDLRTVTPASEVATKAHVPGIVACLERNGRRAALAPVWRRSDLEGPVLRSGLELSDLRVHLEKGHVRGCIGAWDQTSFRQTVIRAYPRASGIWTLFGKRPDDRRRYLLPAEGSRLRCATVSHLAVDGDDPSPFRSLVAGAALEARRRRLDHVVLVLGRHDPFADVLRDFVPAWELPVELLAILWGDAQEELRALGAGPIRPDVALL